MQVPIIYSFQTTYKNKDCGAYRILKDDKEEYLLIEEELLSEYEGIMIVETDKLELIDFKSSILFFVKDFGFSRPVIKYVDKKGYFVKDYKIKPANEKPKREAVEMMTYEFGQIVGDKVITNIGSRWKQKKTSRMLEYVYFDKKHLHNIYKNQE